MKFWIDENVHIKIAKALERNGHEIRTAKRGTQDSPILICATEENAVIITHDKDFERYVLREGKPCTGIILIRFDKHNRLEELIAKLLRLIRVHEYKLSTSFVMLSVDGMNIKRLK
jgi:predicted nuclease of predicted toxin-antitoxin system